MVCKQSLAQHTPGDISHVNEITSIYETHSKTLKTTYASPGMISHVKKNHFNFRNKFSLYEPDTHIQ